MKLFVLFLFAALLVSDRSYASECWSQEVDVRTGLRFKSFEEWETVRQGWLQREPSYPGLYDAYRGYLLYKSELENAERARTDKAAHCYMGCRISQDVNQETGVYAGWYKEYEDLTDCDPSSFYDEFDFLATVRGTDLGMSMVLPEDCMSECNWEYDRESDSPFRFFREGT